MNTQVARSRLIAAGYWLSDRPSKRFDNEIVVTWPHAGAVGVIVERAGQVDPMEVEMFIANAKAVRELA